MTAKPQPQHCLLPIQAALCGGTRGLNGCEIGCATRLTLATRLTGFCDRKAALRYYVAFELFEESLCEATDAKCPNRDGFTV